MKALALTGYRHVELVDLAVPMAASDEVLLQVQACGLSAADTRRIQGSSADCDSPQILGEEGVGTIVATGEQVDGLSVSDRVAFTSSDLSSDFSDTKSESSATDMAKRGTNGAARQGAFAEYVAVPAKNCRKLPKVVPLDYAALIRPLAEAAYAVKRIPPPMTRNQTAVVLGGETTSLLALQILQLSGVTTIAVGPNANWLSLARESGVHRVVQVCEVSPSSIQEVATAVLNVTKGRGADVVLDFRGTRPTLRLDVSIARKRGVVVLASNKDESSPGLETRELRARELTVVGAEGADYVYALELLEENKVEIEQLIAARVPLLDVEVWLQRMRAEQNNGKRVILKPML